MQTKTGICFQCKGKLWCGLPSCPVLEKIRVAFPLEQKLSKNVFGESPPNVFVSWMGWPRVSVGPLVGVDESVDAELSDSPGQWFGASYQEIIRFRSSLARGTYKQHVKEKTRVLSDVQDVVLSVKPVDLEVSFKKVPRYKMSFSPVMQPMGPAAELEKLRVAGNPRVPKKVDEVVEEDLSVREALPELVESNLDYYYLQKLLCAGLLGKKKEKRVVPTRWSITATDSMLANLLLKEVREFPETNEILLYSSKYLFNHFEVLLLPGKWEFEQFEAWAPGSAWSPEETRVRMAYEYEPFEGRSDYAESEGGGYYAGRFGCVEALHAMRRQARVSVIREIGEEYKVPVGVWEVRENARNAFRNPPTKFASLVEAFAELRNRLKNPLESYLSRSIVLRQKKLVDF